ncbi:MAG: glycosyltransferase [Deltaproteobacteria bacterium]|nr:glycosyltransferase [Deltaproteobacteria bacterium]
MRILQVVHDFLPNHVAGVEVYTDGLSRRLAVDHEVAILYSEVAPDLPNYSIRRGRHHGLPTYEIVNNHTLRYFDETYRNAAMTARMIEVLDDFRPDVVHIQHLINLSVDFVDELRRRDIPMLMTLHDHWLVCANGGQRFQQELGRCESLDARRCGACTAHMHGVGLLARGLLRRQREAAVGRHAVLHLVDEKPVRSAAPSADFIYRDSYEVAGMRRPTIVAHPPANLEFPLVLEGEACFECEVSLHPDTFEREGGGVEFAVLVDGELCEKRILDPKRKPADREPASLILQLDPGEHRIELRTRAVPEHEGMFCTAGWIDPRVSAAAGVARGRRRPPEKLVRGAVQLSGKLTGVMQRRRVEARWQAMRHVADRIDLFLAPSRYLRDEFIRWGIDSERIVYCDYGFELDAFRPRQALPERTRRFAFVGSLVPHKGVHILLEAFEKLPGDARLDICGSHDYAPDYSAGLRSRIRHPGIRFVGRIEPEGISKFLQGVDCLVVPSIWQENSPLTIHEAFMTGVPVVASRMGGHEGLLGSGGGLLYHADDTDDLAAKLMRLYEEPGLARSLAVSAPPVKSMQDHAVELVDFYTALSRKRNERVSR